MWCRDRVSASGHLLGVFRALPCSITTFPILSVEGDACLQRAVQINECYCYCILIFFFHVVYVCQSLFKKNRAF